RLRSRSQDAAASQHRAVGTKPVPIARVQLPDVRDAFDGHDHPLQAQAPREDGRLQAEWLRDLGPENPAPAQLHPATVRPLDLRLHARLRVRELSGPELRARDAEPSVELLDDPN